jgi:hypothetical protein
VEPEDMCYETMSPGLGVLVCPSRTSERGTREEPSTLTQGAPVFPAVPYYKTVRGGGGG